ncbi:hypothetical protein [Burkholderia anthina]|uniref:Uncharacterized protein n=1 Tax=Burkholderia anthina TaxID=179879 RepID=A0ABS2B3M6_9BURK|nr:hypothetical protein [Burkholderia anthina]MBM2767560.1 hypothetical protein [Burkholderia anthina]
MAAAPLFVHIVGGHNFIGNPVQAIDIPETKKVTRQRLRAAGVWRSTLGQSGTSRFAAAERGDECFGKSLERFHRAVRASTLFSAYSRIKRQLHSAVLGDTQDVHGSCSRYFNRFTQRTSASTSRLRHFGTVIRCGHTVPDTFRFRRRP